MSVIVSSDTIPATQSEDSLDAKEALPYTSSPLLQDDEDSAVEPITPTNSSSNLQSLVRRPGFFSSDTEVDELHETQSTPDHHATSPRARFYFPGPLPRDPVGTAEAVRVLSRAPPHPEARGSVERPVDAGEEEEEQRNGHCQVDRDLVDGPDTPQLDRAVNAGPRGSGNREPGRDYSRRFYVPDLPPNGHHPRARSPERSPPPGSTKKNSFKRSNLRLSPNSSLSTVPAADTMGTPVIVSKAPPHPFTRRIDSNASMSSEVELATTGSTSSSRATVEAKFQVRVPRVLEGEEVRVCGNDTVLGAWDVTKSVPLKQSAE